MQFYKTTGWAEIEGENIPTVLWSGTQADARADKKKLEGDGLKRVETEPVDVPTDKPSLLQFLNDNHVGE